MPTNWSLTSASKNDRIADIELAASPVQSVEFTTSFEEIRERILTANTPHVDAISGATSQSEAVKKSGVQSDAEIQQSAG